MQSKTSFFNTAVLRKNMTRFAPVWGCYTLGLAAALLIMLANGGDAREYWATSHLMEMIYVMGLVNFGYALLTAQLLFGDLYNSRSCYALHAMPLRRESWYLTHVVSGLLFSLIPTAVLTVLALPIAMSGCFVNAWQIPLVLFVAINLQYLCFFGIAVFSTFCAGSRLGMIGVYGILNLGAVLVYAAVENICEPLLFGVQFEYEPYEIYSPVSSFLGRSLFEPERDSWDMFFRWQEAGRAQPLVLHFTHLTQNWGYFGITAAVGAVLLGVSLLLYRKRQLECAGDLLAFKALEPVFTVLAALAAAVGARLVYTNVSNVESDYYIALAAGLVVGWFAARMLLERTTRVFRKKTFLGLGILSIFVAVSIGLVYLDPLNIEGRVPRLEDIQTVWFGEYQFSSKDYQSEAEIREALHLHELALEQRLVDTEGVELKEGVTKSREEADPQDFRYAIPFRMRYTMKDGSTVLRRYSVWSDTEAGEILQREYSSPEAALLRNNAENFDPAKLTSIAVDGKQLPGDFCTPEAVQSLWAALMADCQEGTMAQNRYLHTGYFHREKQDNMFDQVRDQPDLTLHLSSGDMTAKDYAWLYVDIFADSKHTVEWLESRGLLEAMGISVVETDYVFSYKN